MPEPEDVSREALRRRLYRPDASEEDRQRFAASTDRRAGGLPETADPARPPRRRLRAAVVLVAGAAVVAGIVVAGRGGQPVPAASASASAPDPAAASVPDPAATVRTDLPPPPSGAPTATPVTVVLGGVPTAAERFHGTGSTVVWLAGTAAPARDGRILVLLASSTRGALGWFATRLSTRTDRVRFSEVVAADDAAGDRERPLTLSSHGYSGSPPTRLAVQAPRDAAWTLTVAFLPRTAPGP